MKEINQIITAISCINKNLRIIKDSIIIKDKSIKYICLKTLIFELVFLYFPILSGMFCLALFCFFKVDIYLYMLFWQIYLWFFKKQFCPGCQVPAKLINNLPFIANFLSSLFQNALTIFLNTSFFFSF